VIIDEAVGTPFAVSLKASIVPRIKKILFIKILDGYRGAAKKENPNYLYLWNLFQDIGKCISHGK